ncbi:MAG: putative tail protein [Thermoproteota archaeon]|nr:putative tail protein [Thermoproteota archaeon]
MTLYVGPAVGARGQIGFAEEGAWGCQQQTPDKFVEMNGEGIVSEIGTLVSGALRSDRAVHKMISGVEAAGGDVECEIAPKGFETWFKHALGDVTTTRVDTAFIIECTNRSETKCELTITHTAGVATNLAIDMDIGADVSLDLTNASYDAIAEVMAAINAHANLACYSPYQAIQGVWQTTIHASDYLAGTDNSNCLEECDNIDILSTPSRMWVVGTEWGVYSHQIQCGASLPPGASIEAGRDVAAFLYSGSKINTMELSAQPSEFFMGTFGFMAKGATTASTPTAISTNTGNAKNAFKIRYTGENPTATLAIDSSNYTITIGIDGTSEDILHNLNEPYVDPLTGIVYNLQRLGGLVDYLNDLSYMDCQIADYANPNALSTTINHYPAADITSADYVWFNFEHTGTKSLPVLWGDYIGSDVGDSVRFYIQVVVGGATGTATLQFKKTTSGSYGNTATTSATEPTEVRTDANVDSGFTVFFPDNTELVAGDTWYFETIKPVTSATYATIDPFSGFEGALSLDSVSAAIMGWTCTVNNNLFGEKYHLGERTRAKEPEQKRNVEGTVNAEFDDLDFYRKFINKIAMDLSMVFTSADYISTTALGNSASQYSMTVRQPNIKFGGTTPTASDEGIITVDLPYTAMWDDINNIPELRITVVSNVPYV